MGEPNASIPTPQPVYMRPMFGAMGKATGTSSLAFVSAAGEETVGGYGLNKHIEPVMNCRNVTKKDLRLNDTTPKITVDPETYTVIADGEVLKCEPAEKLPLAQRFSLF